MKNFKFIALLFLTVFFSCTADQTESTNEVVLHDMPEYSIIVEKFFEKYTIEDLDQMEVMRFEKQPKGWYAVVIDYDQNQEKVVDELFWDAEVGKYMDVDFPMNNNAENGEAYTNKYLKDWNRRNFDLQPYFGYVGWESDVIDLLKDEKDLSDDRLNALARAYSAHAMNLLNNNSGWADKEDMYNLSIGGNAMSKKQVDEYRKYEHLSIETFKKLEQQNPDYPVIVGSVNSKWSNEYMTTFLNYRIYQNEEEARKELKEDLYSPAMLSWAKNILASCSKNAILFTNGDNDTYPLLYLQAKQNYRTDVLVVNLSLLNTLPYISSLTRQIPGFESLPLELGLSMDELVQDEAGYVYVGDEQLIPSLELETAIANLYHITNLNEGVYTLPSPNVIISGGEAPIEIVISDNYLYRGDLVMFDIIGKNHMKRPVHFTEGWTFNNSHGLGPYLELHGMVLNLMTDRVTKSYISMDYLIQAENLLNGYDFTGLKNIAGEEERILQDYNRKFNYCISHFHLNDNDMAMALIKRQLEVFPENPKYYDESNNAIRGILKSLGEFELLAELKENLIENLDNMWDIETRQKLSEEKKESILEHLNKLMPH
jgi:hypothetical protein